MTFGEIPQKKVSKSSKLQKELTTLYSNDFIDYTGKIYKFYERNQKRC